MDIFIIVQNEARIFESIPSVRLAALSRDLIKPFPHILEYGKQKFDKVFLNSLNLHYHKGVEFCYVHKGRYNWVVEDNEYTLYPGDTFITCPWELHGGKRGSLDLGILSWLIIQPDQFCIDKDLRIGDWSSIPQSEQALIGTILKEEKNRSFNNPQIGDILNEIFRELVNTKLAYKKRINSLVEDLFIIASRSFLEKECHDTKSDCFDLQRLEMKLLSNIGHPWTVCEMAELVNMGVTSFIEKTKKATGLTPINFLIDLRIKEAITRLQNTDSSFYRYCL
jgi:mannose-6-phosphate isomerase-like protein (cupin superfamily)